MTPLDPLRWQISGLRAKLAKAEQDREQLQKELDCARQTNREMGAKLAEVERALAALPREEFWTADPPYRGLWIRAADLDALLEKK